LSFDATVVRLVHLVQLAGRSTKKAHADLNRVGFLLRGAYGAPF
jgi:hypothetical protein